MLICFMLNIFLHDNLSWLWPPQGTREHEMGFCLLIPDHGQSSVAHPWPSQVRRFALFTSMSLSILLPLSKLKAMSVNKSNYIRENKFHKKNSAEHKVIKGNSFTSFLILFCTFFMLCLLLCSLFRTQSDVCAIFIWIFQLCARCHKNWKYQNTYWTTLSLCSEPYFMCD